MRSGAQVVSYELSVGLALLSIVIFSGSMQFSGNRREPGKRLVDFQGSYPGFDCICYFPGGRHC